jgi:hypothetical protein
VSWVYVEPPNPRRWRPLRWVFLAVALATAAWLSAQARGHPAGSPFAGWYNSRMQPDAPGTSCCGVGEASDVDAVEPDPRVPGGLRALVGSALEGTERVGGEWYSVPPWKIGWEDVNPTGRAVIYLQRTEFGFPPWVACYFPDAGT